MPRRAAFTQAELARAIRAAAETGRVAVQTPIGIAFLDPAALPQTASQESGEGANTCDAIWGAR
ncbi:MAG: hypothetical protein ACK4OP_01530 [Gemmobacter sp.]